MTTNERIRQLRKTILDLTQEEFALKLKVTPSNIGSIEIGRIRPTKRIIADICREWSINEKWLNCGEEPVFVDKADSFTHKIVAIYESLNSDNRKYLKGYLDRLLEEQKALEKINSNDR